MVLTIGIGMLIYSQYQGRAISRILGIANHVPLPACVHRPEQVISISFHNDPKGGTLKDVNCHAKWRCFIHAKWRRYLRQ